jgi:FkbM family methyltransferase
MKFVKKVATFGRLLLSGDRALLQNRARYNWLTWQTWRFGGRPFVFRKDGIRLVCFPANADSQLISALPSTDQFEFSLLRQWLRPGDGFIDGGANLGTYAAAAAQFVGASGWVLAIDAGETLVPLLDESARLLGHRHWRSLHAAIGDHNGQASFYQTVEGGSTLGQSLRVERSQLGQYRECHVPMLTLASLASEYCSDMPVAVKLDLEGAEGQAVGSSPDSWRQRDGPLWIVEINPTALALFDSAAATIPSYFPTAAFEHWVVPKGAGAGGAPAPPRPLTPSETWSDSSYYNLLAIPLGKQHQDRRGRLERLLRRGSQIHPESAT